MLQTLLISVILAITVSALCSVCEAVLYSISASQVEMLKKSGDQTAFHLQKLRADIDEPITAILTLNTIANTVGAAVAGASAARLFGDQNFILFSVHQQFFTPRMLSGRFQCLCFPTMPPDVPELKEK